ncbi:transporter [Agrobacterium tumefaciens]|nr:transporter [Agrobacterium tumefaciens]NTE26351.1 transporter [Agrobacterium tumefaciens]
MKKLYFLTCCMLFLTLKLFAQEKKSKSYNLFRPVPKAELREMETERPDVTESPITLDAGHFQYESDLFRLEREQGENAQTNTYLFNQANLKLGLTRSTAIQLVVQSFVYQKEKSVEDGTIERAHGFGDLTLRIKQNILGNDKGNFAIAVIPYLKFPTSHVEEENRYEGGLIIPMSLKLPREWNVGMQMEVDRLQDTEGAGLHTEILQSFTIGHSLMDHVTGIAETYYRYDFSHHHWGNFLNAALQVELAKDVKLDGGLNYGIQHDAMKSYFLGLSFRL